jgi:hypothetical protein
MDRCAKCGVVTTNIRICLHCWAKFCTQCKSLHSEFREYSVKDADKAHEEEVSIPPSPHLSQPDEDLE